MVLNCELISVEIDGKYIVYSSDRAVFEGVLKMEPVWAQLLNDLGESFELSDAEAWLAGSGMDPEQAENSAKLFISVLARAGIVDSEQFSDAGLPGVELIVHKPDTENYSSMNTGCYYNSCCDCVEFNGWMTEDNEKPHIAML